jgi:hypothetical protein
MRCINFSVCDGVGTSSVTWCPSNRTDNSKPHQVLHHWQPVTLCHYHGNNSPWLSTPRYAGMYKSMPTQLQGIFSYYTVAPGQQQHIRMVQPNQQSHNHQNGYAIWALKRALHGCIWLTQAPHLDLHTGAGYLTFIPWLPHWGMKLEVMPKTWDSTTEIGKIPAGVIGVYNCREP